MSFNLKKYLEKSSAKVKDATLTEYQLRNTGKDTPKEPEQISEAQLAKQRTDKDPDTITEKQLDKVRKESGSEVLIEKQLDTSKSKIVTHRSDTYSGNVPKLEEQRLAGKPVEKEKYEDAATTDKKKMFPQVKGKDGLKTASFVVKASLQSDIFEALDVAGKTKRLVTSSEYASVINSLSPGLSNDQINKIINDYVESKRPVQDSTKTAQTMDYFLGQEEDIPDPRIGDIGVDTVIDPTEGVIEDDDFDIEDIDDEDGDDDLDRAIDQITKDVDLPSEADLSAVERGDMTEDPADQVPIFTVTPPVTLDAGGTDLIQFHVQFDPFSFDNDKEAVTQALVWMSGQYPNLDIKKAQKGMVKDIANGRLTFVLPRAYEKMFS